MKASRLDLMVSRWRITELVETLLSPGACEVLETWLRDHRFLDKRGDPAMLSLSEKEQSEFAQLVYRANQRLEVNQVFWELARMGLVEQLDTEYVMLRRSAYGPGNTGPLGERRSALAARGMLCRRHNDIHPDNVIQGINKEKKP